MADRTFTITQQSESRTFTATTGLVGNSHAVSYADQSAQARTDAEKAQARANIGAASEASGADGDMLAATYDPTSVEGDAFSMDNMVEGADTKILTAAERAAISASTSHTNDTSNPHSVTATQVGLSNADNTSDADKPVSTAQQTALDLKADDADLTSHTNDTSNPHSVTATQVGLGSVDNTSDADKPVSTAQQTALDDKAHTSAFSRVAPISETSFYQFDPTDTSGFTLSNATFASDASGDFATLIATDAPTNTGSALETITNPTSGDYIFYAKLRADSVAGSGVNIQLADSPAHLVMSLGYNWATSSYEADRISFGARDGGTLANKIAGPSIEYDNTIVEIAAHYDSRHGCVNFLVKENGLWVSYGGFDCDEPFDGEIKFYTGGNDAADAYIYDVKIVRPAVVSIGDSITAGHNFYDPAPAFYGGNDPITNSWQGYAGFDSSTASMIVNAGVGSEDSSDILARIPALLTACEPEVVFLQMSSNDYGAGFTATQRTGYTQDSIDLIVATGAKVILLNAVYPDGLNGDYYQSWWQNNRYDLTDVSEYIDTMEGLTGGDGYNDSTLFEADGVHPKAAGFAIMGGKIQTRINWLESGDRAVKSDTHATLKSVKTPNEYTNDAAAAVGGVPVGGIYRQAAGVVAWRQT